MSDYTQQNFEVGALLTANQMNQIDSGLFTAFENIKSLSTKITDLEERINSGNLGNEDSNTGSGNGSAITNIDEIKTTILKSVYPIGSIYSSFEETLPRVLFGFGSWEQIKNRFLVASGEDFAPKSSGGSIKHSLPLNLYSGYTDSSGTYMLYVSDPTTGEEEILPPYLAVYMWQRVQDRFFINEQECQVEEGMTWAEWCASDYNTTNYSENNEGYISNVDDYISLNGEKIKSNSLIILDTNYSIINDPTQSS